MSTLIIRNVASVLFDSTFLFEGTEKEKACLTLRIRDKEGNILQTIDLFSNEQELIALKELTEDHKEIPLFVL